MIEGNTKTDYYMKSQLKSYFWFFLDENSWDENSWDEKG